jgi:type IV pilus assembly protein PilB
MVSTIIKHAIEEDSSDIHIEPTREDIRVRYRVDGELYTSVRLPKYMHNSIVTRIKVMAGLKIDENRIPQDGRVRLSVNNHFYDFRISIIPISILKKSSTGACRE